MIPYSQTRGTVPKKLFQAPLLSQAVLKSDTFPWKEAPWWCGRLVRSARPLSVRLFLRLPHLSLFFFVIENGERQNDPCILFV